MSSEFNKQRMLDNIAFFLKETKMKIGELEEKAGVSLGYISRISKESSSKPGIDFVIKVADALNVSIDTLLNAPVAQMTPTEEYLAAFLERLTEDTLADKLEWIKESPVELSRLETDYDGNVYHHLFSLEEYTRIDKTGQTKTEPRIVFPSHCFGLNTYIDKDCFWFQIDRQAQVYLMSIKKGDLHPGETEEHAIEIQVCPHIGNPQYLCSDYDLPLLAPYINELYRAVSSFSKHPKVRKDIRNLIDAFMNNRVDSLPETASDNNTVFMEIPDGIDDDLPFV